MVAVDEHRGHTEGSSLFIKGLVGYHFGIAIFLSSGTQNVSLIHNGGIKKQLLIWFIIFYSFNFFAFTHTISEL